MMMKKPQSNWVNHPNIIVDNPYEMIKVIEANGI